jgi:hypothetical protein
LLLLLLLACMLLLLLLLLPLLFLLLLLFSFVRLNIRGILFKANAIATFGPNHIFWKN